MACSVDRIEESGVAFRGFRICSKETSLVQLVFVEARVSPTLSGQTAAVTWRGSKKRVLTC